MRLTPLLQPLNIAAIVTVAAIGATLAALPPAHWPVVYGLLLAFGVLMLLPDLVPAAPRWAQHAALVAMGAIALLLLWQFPRAGSLPILSVIWAAMIASAWGPRRAAPALLVANLVAWWILHDAGFRSPLMSVVLFACFQLFAVLTVHYARSAEASRDALALVNADLLATRALLADSTRDAERLRVARELHDVAGHKLTAMRLNLRELSADPALAGHEGIALAERLSGELLSDIRRVVQSLRDERGLDLATALHALAAPFPRPALQLTIAPGVRVADPAVAETVLRLAQEALTNAARHAGAGQVWLRIDSEEQRLHIDIHDDGQCGSLLREGNGIAGMRDRIRALGGSLLVHAPRGGGTRLQVRVPWREAARSAFLAGDDDASAMPVQQAAGA